MKKLISCKFVLIRGFFQTSNMLQRFNFKLALMYPEIGIFLIWLPSLILGILGTFGILDICRRIQVVNQS